MPVLIQTTAFIIALLLSSVAGYREVRGQKEGSRTTAVKSDGSFSQALRDELHREVHRLHKKLEQNPDYVDEETPSEGWKVVDQGEHGPIRVDFMSPGELRDHRRSGYRWHDIKRLFFDKQFNLTAQVAAHDAASGEGNLHQNGTHTTSATSKVTRHAKVGGTLSEAHDDISQDGTNLVNSGSLMGIAQRKVSSNVCFQAFGDVNSIGDDWLRAQHYELLGEVGGDKVKVMCKGQGLESTTEVSCSSRFDSTFHPLKCPTRRKSVWEEEGMNEAKCHEAREFWENRGAVAIDVSKSNHHLHLWCPGQSQEVKVSCKTECPHMLCKAAPSFVGRGRFNVQVVPADLPCSHASTLPVFDLFDDVILREPSMGHDRCARGQVRRIKHLSGDDFEYVVKFQTGKEVTFSGDDVDDLRRVQQDRLLSSYEKLPLARSGKPPKSYGAVVREDPWYVAQKLAAGSNGVHDLEFKYFEVAMRESGRFSVGDVFVPTEEGHAMMVLGYDYEHAQAFVKDLSGNSHVWQTPDFYIHVLKNVFDSRDWLLSWKLHASHANNMFVYGDNDGVLTVGAEEPWYWSILPVKGSRGLVTIRGQRWRMLGVQADSQKLLQGEEVHTFYLIFNLDGTFSLQSQQTGKYVKYVEAESTFFLLGDDLEDRAATRFEYTLVDVDSANVLSSTELAPPKMQPMTSIGATACVQFDIDFFATTGVPLLASVAVIGSVNYLMASACWAWRLDLKVQFSVGFPLMGEAARMSLIIATALQMQEVPLNAAKKELKWYLPKDTDTSKCLTKDPFDLFKPAIWQGWRFVVDNVIGHEKHAVVEASETARSFDAAAKHYREYCNLRQTKGISRWETRSARAVEAPCEVRIDSAVAVHGKTSLEALSITVHLRFGEAADVLDSFLQRYGRRGHVVAKAVLETDTIPGIPYVSRSSKELIEDRSMQVVLPNVPSGMVKITIKFTDELGATILVGKTRMSLADLTGVVAPMVWKRRSAKGGVLAVDALTVQPGCTFQSVAVQEGSSSASTWSKSVLDAGAFTPWAVHVDLEATKDADASQNTIKDFTFLKLSQAQLASLMKIGSTESVTWSTGLGQLKEKFVDIVREGMSEDAISLLDRDSAETFLRRVFSHKNRPVLSSCGLPSSTPMASTIFNSRAADKWLEDGIQKEGRTASKVWSSVKDKDIGECQDLHMEFTLAEGDLFQCRNGCTGVPTCNVVRYQAVERAGHVKCGFYKCPDSRAGFANVIGAKVDYYAYRLEKKDIMLHLTPEGYSEIFRMMADDELSMALKELSTCSPVENYWKKEVVDWVSQSAYKIWSFHLRSGSVFEQGLMALLAQDHAWMLANSKSEKIVKAQTEIDNSFKMRVMLEGNTVNHWSTSAIDKTILKTGGSRKWTEEVVIDTCKVDINWSFQVDDVEGFSYGIRPQAVPVAQAFFAAYDSFQSKLPAYADQVSVQLAPKERSMMSSAHKLSTRSEYKQADGRFLHRHLYHAEDGTVDISKGEFGTEDYVMNYYRAMEESSHRNSDEFMINTGLSVANLMVRVVQDVQALFNLYMANHPDWDGMCSALPPRFHLLHEGTLETLGGMQKDGWAAYDGDTRKIKQEPAAFGARPTHRAGNTVFSQGAALTEDELKVITNWHWASNAQKRNFADHRSRFMRASPPVHGKDHWATLDPTEASAVMWPHIWCELSQKFFSGKATVVKQEAPDSSSHLRDRVLRSLGMPPAFSVVKEIKEMIREESSGAANPFVTELQKHVKHVKERSVFFGCVNIVNETADNMARKVADHFGEYATMLANLVGVVQAQVIPFVQTTLDNQAVSNDEKDASTLTPETVKAKEAELGTVEERLELFLQKLSSISMPALQEGLKMEGDPLNEDRTRENVLKYVQFTDKLIAEIEDRNQVNRETQDQLYRLVTDVLGMDEDEDVVKSRTQDDDFVANVRADRQKTAETARLGQEILNHVRSMSLLVTSVSMLQMRELDSLNKFYFQCKQLDVTSPPLALDEINAMLTKPREKSRMELIAELRARSGLDAGGVELFFDVACKLPPGFDGRGAGQLGMDRSECERIFLTPAFVTILPTFVKRVLDTKDVLSKMLEDLITAGKTREERKGTVISMMDHVKSFLANIREGMDDDFYSAFAFKPDGTMFGELWQFLPGALVIICNSAEERAGEARKWVIEGVMQRNALEKARRSQVRRKAQQNSDHVIKTDDPLCACEEAWGAYVTTKATSRWRFSSRAWRDFGGCVAIPQDVTHVGGQDVVTAWPTGRGVCKTKTLQKVRLGGALCSQEFVSCDVEGSAVEVERYRVWRTGWGDDIELPLLSLTYFVHVDLRFNRANFCGPNLAPLLIQQDWTWKIDNWKPWDLVKSSCFAGRVHPPGMYFLVSRCAHGGKNSLTQQEKKKSNHVAWALDAAFYLLKHDNVWGSPDDAGTRSWFTGTENGWFSHPKMDWPNMIQQEVWSHGKGGYSSEINNQISQGDFVAHGKWGFLNNEAISTSPTFFIFGIIAELFRLWQDRAEIQGIANNLTPYTMVEKSLRVIWMVLKRVGKIAATMAITWGVSQLTNYLTSLAHFSPPRTEVDIVLRYQHTWTWRQSRRDLTAMLPDLSRPQLLDVLQSVVDSGVKVNDLWRDFLHNEFKLITGDAEIGLTHLSRSELRRRIMEVLVAKFDSTGNIIEEQEAAFISFFQSCARGRPQRFEVAKDNAVFPFWRKDTSAWMEPALAKAIGSSSLLLTRDEDGWWIEIKDDKFEPTFFHNSYMRQKALKRVVDESKAVLRTVPELEAYLDRAAVTSLACLVQQITESARHTEVDTTKPSTFRKSIIGAFLKSKWSTILAQVDGEDPSLGLIEVRQRSGSGGMTALTPKQQDFLKRTFYRGSASKVVFNKDGRESQELKTSNALCVLNIATRFGLPFATVPGLLLVQGYLGMTMNFDVLKLITAISARYRARGSGIQTDVQKHLIRQEKCKDCARRHLAFCDRQQVASVMLAGGHTEQMDECMPLTATAKRQCLSFTWNTNDRVSDGGLAFKRDICPCYETATGAVLTPEWITTADRCNEMRWPGAYQEARAATKISDWNTGLGVQLAADRIQLANRLNFDKSFEDRYKLIGCHEGFKCCKARGDQKDWRCVNEKNLYSTYTLWKKAKCKNFGIDGRSWDHEKDPAKCSWQVAEFQGYFEKEGSKWKRDDSKAPATRKNESSRGGGEL